MYIYIVTYTLRWTSTSADDLGEFVEMTTYVLVIPYSCPSFCNFLMFKISDIKVIVYIDRICQENKSGGFYGIFIQNILSFS